MKTIGNVLFSSKSLPLVPNSTRKSQNSKLSSDEKISIVRFLIFGNYVIRLSPPCLGKIWPDTKYRRKLSILQAVNLARLCQQSPSIIEILRIIHAEIYIPQY